MISGAERAMSSGIGDGSQLDEETCEDRRGYCRGPDRAGPVAILQGGLWGRRRFRVVVASGGSEHNVHRKRLGSNR